MTTPEPAAPAETPAWNIEGRRMRHKARGTYYTIIGSAIHTEDSSALIVYRSESDGELWARPLAMFLDGRFEFVRPRSQPAAERVKKSDPAAGSKAGRNG